MALVAPLTQIKLITVPFEKDYYNVIDFGAPPHAGTPNAQTSYFLGLSGKTIDNFMYVRQNESIKVPYCKDDIIQYNYVMYKNSEFSNKWYYAFITDIRYINPNTSEVFLKTDVFQTYYFESTFKTSFIEREHQNRWTTAGAPIYNLLPENLDTGNACVSRKTVNPNTDGVVRKMQFLIFANHALAANEGAGVYQADGAPFSFLYTYLLDGTWADILAFTGAYTDTQSSISQYIISIQAYFGGNLWSGPTPTKNAYGLIPLNQITYAPHEVASFTASTSDFGISQPAINAASSWAYESKLLTYPYSFFELSLSDGNKSIYKYEHLTNTGKIYSYASVTPFQKTIYFLSGDYLGVSNNPQNFVEANSNYDLPLLSSAWSNYMASNKAAITTGVFNSLASGVTSSIISTAAQNPIGLTNSSLSILNSISSVMAKMQDLETSPASYSSGATDFFIDFASKNALPILYYKQIPTQFLQSIGDYFIKFGYKCNRIKVPNPLTRHRFNYLKTINCEIVCDIPQDDLMELKSIFDTGVTLWHDPSYYLDYSIDNTEQDRF